jgi:hypothetical protein
MLCAYIHIFNCLHLQPIGPSPDVPYPAKILRMKSKFESPVLNGALLGALLRPQYLYGCTWFGTAAALYAAYCSGMASIRCNAVAAARSVAQLHNEEHSFMIMRGMFSVLFLGPCFLLLGYYAAGYSAVIGYTLFALNIAMELLLAAGRPHDKMFTAAASGANSVPGTRYFGAVAALG